MSPTLAGPSRRSAPAVTATGSRGALTDLLAPAVLVLWMVLYFEPFVIIYPLPGAASSVLFPAVCVAILLFTPADRLRRIPVVWPLVLVVVILAASIAWTENPGATLYRIRADLPATVLLAAVVGTIPPHRVVRTVAVASTVIAAWSLLISMAWPLARQAPFDEAYLGVQDGFRGTFLHKNQLGVFLMFGLGALLVQRRGPRRTAAIVLHVATMLATRSASVGGGALAVAFVWLWLSAIERQERPRARAFLLVMSIASAVAAVLLVLGLMPVLLDLYDKDVTFSGRTFIWSESMVTFWEQPLLGYGLAGVWTDESSTVTADLQARIGFGAAHAHNGALDLALQVGVIGLGAYLLLVLRALRSSVRAMNLPEVAAVGQWGLLSLSALLLVSIAENVFLGPYLMLLGLVATMAARAVADADPSGSQRPVVRRWIRRGGRGPTWRPPTDPSVADRAGRTPRAEARRAHH